MHIQLIGGGWQPEGLPLTYGPFLEAAGGSADIACVVLDEGDGDAQFRRWEAALRTVRSCAPGPVLVPLGEQLDVTALDGADALLVCGGLTPAYADALAPVADQVRQWLADGDRPYAGFSAGAAVAAQSAVVGGWLSDGTQVCPEDAGEDLEEVTAVDGLALVPYAVDVHCSSWGTLGRLVAAVGARLVSYGVALDEDTALCSREGQTVVQGLGRAYLVQREPTGLGLQVLGPGDTLSP